MKTSIKVGAALLLAGILIATTLPRKATAQGPRRIQTWTVVLSGNERYEYGSSTPTGFVVDLISASPTAPVIKQNQNLAEALNILREAGGTVYEHSGFFAYTVTGPVN